MNPTISRLRRSVTPAVAVVRRVLPRHTTVAAYLALMLASSGAAYAAATIGSAEVVNNSLQSVDLKDGAAVGGVDVINDSLTGADVKEATLNGVARALVHSEAAAAFDGTRVVSTTAGYELLVRCYVPPGAGSWLNLELSLRGPAGTAQFYRLVWPGDVEDGFFTDPGGAVLSAGTAVHLGTMSVYPGNYTRSVAGITIISGASVVQFDLHLLADDRATPTCSIWGTAMKAA